MEHLKFFLSQTLRGYIDVGDGCWRRNVLVTAVGCWRPIPYIQKSPF